MFHQTHNLAGFLEGALPPNAAARVQGHLESCARCRGALAEMRAAGWRLEAVGQSVKAPQLDSELWSRVRSQIATPRRSTMARSRWAMAGGGLAFAGAAAWLVIAMNAPLTPEPSHALTATGARPPAGAAAKAKTRMAGAPMPKRTDTPNGRFGTPPPEEVPVPRVGFQPSPASAPLRRSASPKKQLMARAPEEPAASMYSATPLVTDSFAAPTAKPKAATELGAVDKFVATNGALGGATASAADAPLTDGAIRLGAAVAPPLAPKDEKSALEIVADRAPEASRVVGLERLPESALVAKSAGGARRGDDASNSLKFRSPGLQTGVSSLEGHRLFARAGEAYALGKTDIASGSYADALKAGLGSLEDRISNTRLGDIAMKANDAPTAIKRYRAALAVRKDAETLAKLGDAYERSGDSKQALTAYLDALALQPGLDTAKAGMERLQGSASK